jgi:hypothetical protein
VTMLRPPLQRAEDQHVEGALQQLQAAFVGGLVLAVDVLRP